MFELKPGVYYLGAWFVRHDDRLPVPQRQDWMAMIWRDTPTSDWIGRYRIATHTSTGLRKHGAPADKRVWYEITIPAERPEDEICAYMEDVATQIAAHNGVPVASVHIKGDSEQALRLLMAQEWFHLAPLPTPKD